MSMRYIMDSSHFEKPRPALYVAGLQPVVSSKRYLLLHRAISVAGAPAAVSGLGLRLENLSLFESGDS